MNEQEKKKLQAIYLMIPFAIAVITCLIVNYAVDQQFTWSLLVTGSCVYAYLALFALLLGGKQRLLWTYAVICVFIVPLSLSDRMDSESVFARSNLLGA